MALLFLTFSPSCTLCLRTLHLRPVRVEAAAHTPAAGGARDLPGLRVWVDGQPGPQEALRTPPSLRLPGKDAPWARCLRSSVDPGWTRS